MINLLNPVSDTCKVTPNNPIRSNWIDYSLGFNQRIILLTWINISLEAFKGKGSLIDWTIWIRKFDTT